MTFFHWLISLFVMLFFAGWVVAIAFQGTFLGFEV